MGEISDNERAAWSKKDHAERYRQHAGLLQQLAREQLHELAAQYRVVADHIAIRKMRNARVSRSAAVRSRQNLTSQQNDARIRA